MFVAWGLRCNTQSIPSVLYSGAKRSRYVTTASMVLRVSVTGQSLRANLGDAERYVVELFRAGDLAGAEAIDVELASLYKALFITTNPIPVKCALDLLGLPAGSLRLPMVDANEDERATIATELRGQGLL